MPQIGVRAHDLALAGAREIGMLARMLGFDVLQLAPSKALADGPRLYEPIDHEWAQKVRIELDQSRVAVAVLGCYVDLCGPDGDSRRRSVSALADYIDVATFFGSRIVATETPLSGGDRADCLNRLRQALERLLPAAESRRVFLCLEPVWGHAVDTPRRIRELVDDFDSGSLGVVLDPINLVDPASVSDPAVPTLVSLELLSDAIRAVHVKDARIENGRKRTVRIGSGIMDWKRLAPEIACAAPEAPFIIEDQDADGMAAGLSVLRNLP